jgi:hypothetical protein
MTFIGALYNPPVPIYQTTSLIDYIEATCACSSTMSMHISYWLVILTRCPTTKSSFELASHPSIVKQPTRGNSKLDRIHVSDYKYSGVKVVKSAVTSDHLAIVAYSGEVASTVAKTRIVRTFRKHSGAQHSRFLSRGSEPVHIINPDGDQQGEYDRLYETMTKLLDDNYPERKVTITSAGPPYVTPTIHVKKILRRKNKLMRSGQVEKAAALAVKIGVAIKNSAEIS